MAAAGLVAPAALPAPAAAPDPALKNLTHNHKFVEEFALVVAAHLADVAVTLVLLPWSGACGPRPNGLLCPEELGTAAALDEAQVDAALLNTPVLIVACAFDSVEEEAAAWKLLPKLNSQTGVCVLLAHLLPPDLELTRARNDEIIKRHDAMLATGVDDVLMNPDTDVEELRKTVEMARSVWQLNVRRMQLMLDGEVEAVSTEEMHSLVGHHRKMLWDSIPRALMPKFKLMDKTLSETSTSVGGYHFVRYLQTKAGNVLQGHDENGMAVCIKLIEKNTVSTPGELEGIYREFRFLTEMLQHPNIAQCTEMMHSPSRVYLVFKYAGDRNLVQALNEQPGDRFEVDVALHCFGGLCAALAFMHSKEICHRGIALEHVVLFALPGRRERYHVTLVDLHVSMVSRGDATSRVVAGRLPCIPPEVARGANYLPRRADCWSAGVVLLEMSGGLNTMHLALPYNPQSDPEEVAPIIEAYFLNPGSHEMALAFLSGSRDPRTVEKLEALLQPNPAKRKAMEELLDPTWESTQVGEV